MHGIGVLTVCAPASGTTAAERIAVRDLQVLVGGLGQHSPTSGALHLIA